MHGSADLHFRWLSAKPGHEESGHWKDSTGPITRSLSIVSLSQISVQLLLIYPIVGPILGEPPDTSWSEQLQTKVQLQHDRDRQQQEQQWPEKAAKEKAAAEKKRAEEEAAAEALRLAKEKAAAETEEADAQFERLTAEQARKEEEQRLAEEARFRRKFQEDQEKNKCRQERLEYASDQEGRSYSPSRTREKG